MKSLNRILQFGTSRFLQAHVDLFVHDAIEAGQNIGPITIVKTTFGGERSGRVDAFNSTAGFPVRLRGFHKGELVDETTQVKSVSRALDAHADWNEVKRIFAFETEFVISNVGESGYDLQTNDEGAMPKSFPAKLHTLLRHRFETTAMPLTIFPCELVSKNGEVLRGILNTMSKSAGCSIEFQDWLATKVLICDTLVDRIVSEAIEPVGAIGEPYGLWAIKRVPGFVEPLQHSCVTYTNDLEPFLRLKLHILNLGHTYLAHMWQSEERPKDETVRNILQDAEIKQRLMSLYANEVTPGFAAQGMEDAARKYVTSTVERFENPFLNHRLSDISQNHAYKIERRIVDFMAWAHERNPALQFPVLKLVAETR